MLFLQPLFNTQKHNIAHYMEKNFKDNIHYIKFKNNIKIRMRGGQNNLVLYFGH
jgi:hypothetical protein